MALTELASPAPRSVSRQFAEARYRIEKRQYLTVPSRPPTIDFFRVLSRRRSRREFASLARSRIATFLWYTAKIWERERDPRGGFWEHRPAPSAGGCHPIDVILTNILPHPREVYLYDPIGHSLGQVALVSKASYRRLHALVNTLMPSRGSVIVWFVADFGRTLARYRHGESLVWRDAGALLATMNLVAEALGMNCCALGVTGDPWVSRMVQAGKTVRGVGGCLIGGRVR